MTGAAGIDRVCLFGAPLDTGNLGVSALGESTLRAVERHRPDARVLVFDNGAGRRTDVTNGLPPHDRDGAWMSRRLHRSESLWMMDASSRWGLPRNRNVRSIRASGFVLDISGGDSFTDLYGLKRWRSVAIPKQVVRRLGVPLVLLPQTYGPFRDADIRSQAREIVRSAESAWARDEESLDVLRDLLGADFDESRHHSGVDVAFALPARPPEALAEPVVTWLEDGSEPVVGLNVSGLVMNPERARRQFGLTVDYPQLVVGLAMAILEAGVSRLVLVPHVRGGSFETDDAACRDVEAILGSDPRVAVLPPGLDAGETKWCISAMDWFCGTRMHATIAALSSGVPVAAIAYSPKTRGVFATCGLEHAVVDARKETTEDALDWLVACFETRDEDRKTLATTMPDVVRRADQQFATILRRDTVAS